MEVITALKQKTYLVIAIISAAIMFYILPYIQTLGTGVDIWYNIIPIQHLLLFILFGAVFGIFISFQVYKFRGPKVCKMERKSTTGGVLGTIFTFFVGVCPACAGLASLFFPLGIVTALSVLGSLFVIISIGIMLLSIYLNGGFKSVQKQL